MNSNLETVALLMELSLPDGYQVRVVKGRLYLFDPQGIPLHGPKDPALLEDYAWRHAWQRIAAELNEELADLRAGVRPVHRSRRLRQYMRMLDAVRESQTPRPVEPLLVRRPVVAWGVLAASAAAIAAVFLLMPIKTGRVPESPLPRTSMRPTTMLSARPAAPASPSGNARVVPAANAVRATRTRPYRPAFGHYAISFGKFVDHATAETMMHFIRSKGYIVYVARAGEDFLVITRPYRTRLQAERLVSALQEIRLPAQLAPARAIQGISRPSGGQDIRRSFGRKVPPES